MIIGKLFEMSAIAAKNTPEHDLETDTHSPDGERYRALPLPFLYYASLMYVLNSRGFAVFPEIQRTDLDLREFVEASRLLRQRCIVCVGDVFSRVGNSTRDRRITDRGHAHHTIVYGELHLISDKPEFVKLAMASIKEKLSLSPFSRSMRIPGVTKTDSGLYKKRVIVRYDTTIDERKSVNRAPIPPKDFLRFGTAIDIAFYAEETPKGEKERTSLAKYSRLSTKVTQEYPV